jgi:dihydrodipicolinate synthase/N-acetylneuraminate lyase
VALDQAIVSGDQQRCLRLEARMMEFLLWADLLPWPAAAKEALKQRKLKSGALATPLGPEGDRKLAEFAEWFRGWLPGVLRECRRTK